MAYDETNSLHLIELPTCERYISLSQIGLPNILEFGMLYEEPDTYICQNDLPVKEVFMYLRIL